MNNLLGTRANGERDLIRVPANPNPINSMRLTVGNKLPVRHKLVMNFILIRHSNFSLNNTYNINLLVINKLSDFFLLGGAV